VTNKLTGEKYIEATDSKTNELNKFAEYNNTTTTILRPLYRSTCVSRHLQLRTVLENFAGAKFYCTHALPDGDQRIRIWEKTLEFSTTVLSTLSPYLFSELRNTVV